MHRCQRYGKPYSTSLNGSYAVVDDLYSGVLLVVETAVEKVAVHKDVDALALEIFRIVQNQI